MPLIAGQPRFTPVSLVPNGTGGVVPSSALCWRLEELTTALAHVERVWEAAAAKNPFVSPSFLRVMHAAAAPTDRTICALGSDAEGVPMAAWILRLDRAGTLHFLPREYSDQSTCIVLPRVDVHALGEGLAFAARETGARRLELTNIPSWGLTLGAVRHAMGCLGWPGRAFPAWPCPVLRVPAGAGAGAVLRESIEQHKRLRGYANALRREPGYAFEVLEDATDLDGWCGDFCDAHEARWNGTESPSPYSKPADRALLRATLGAWATDAVLVRFAIRNGGRRVALVAALRARTRLIYHHVVASPVAERSRAGHVLIRLIGLWMSDRAFDALDFGAGGEAYKFRYANVDEPLWRVFAASNPLSRTFVRGIVEERIRRSPVLQRGWDRMTNGHLGVEMRQWLTAVLARATSSPTVDRTATD